MHTSFDTQQASYSKYLA